MASGGFWGLLIGLLFGGPLFGALLGMAGLFGRNIDLGQYIGSSSPSKRRMWTKNCARIQQWFRY